VPHGAHAATPSTAQRPADDDAVRTVPQDDDERFIVGLVLTYYRRHPQRARTRLLDLLGEVLIYVPSMARFRKAYLDERIAAAHLATLSLEASPDGQRALAQELLSHAGVLSVVLREPAAEWCWEAAPVQQV
jgi:hypothetical protein